MKNINQKSYLLLILDNFHSHGTLKKCSINQEFEFSKSLMKAVKIDKGGFEKLFSSFIFFWKSQLQHSVLNY